MQFPAVIRDCLIKHWLVFANDLSAERKIKWEPLHLTLKPGVELPTKCRRARLTAAHWRPRAKAIIERMYSAGVLIQVDDMTPSVCAGFFVKKPHVNGIRSVSDYTGVNKALERPAHHFPAPEEVWQRVTAGSKYFIAGDLAPGYWQCESDEESSFLSTCLTEFGKFRFTRLSMGILSSGDLFNQTTNRIIEGMTNIVKEVDNMLLFSDTLEGVAENLEEMLTRFEANNVRSGRRNSSLARKSSLPGCA